MGEVPGAGLARLLALAALAVLAACDQRGFSGLQAEWDRRHSGPYHIVNANHDRAVVSALGRQVAIEPSEGFCLAEESIETTRRSAFALIGDCVLEEGGAKGRRSDRGELYLPRGVPGIITVSISGDPGFDEGGDPLSDLGRYLDTPDGRALLGRSGDGSAVKVMESRRIGNAVYVLVEDGGDAVVPVLDSQFWRAFMEVNDRLAVVTVSRFRARPLDNDQMLKYLVNQVETLAAANAYPINEEPQTRLARGERRTQPLPDAGEGQLLSEIVLEAVVVATEEQVDPVLWPLPRQRPTRGTPEAEEEVQTAAHASTPAPEPATPGDPSEGEDDVAAATDTPAEDDDQPATANAPETAPIAPRRPRA